MDRYTIEDIEIIRRKSGISYKEAVNLLEYHNGNLAKALVDLERNGRIKPEADQKNASSGHKATNRRKVTSWLTWLYRSRLLVKKGDIVILNFSVLFSLALLIFSPHMLIAGLIISLILGYRFSYVRQSRDFAKDDLESMVRHAADNVKQTVQSFAKDIGSDSDEHASDTGDERSFYRAGTQKAAPADQTSSKPDATRPVTVNCPQDGQVQVEETKDGYSEATIR